MKNVLLIYFDSLFANFYSNTKSLQLFCEKTSLWANFTEKKERVIHRVNSWNFTPDHKYITQASFVLHWKIPCPGKALKWDMKPIKQMCEIISVEVLIYHWSSFRIRFCFFRCQDRFMAKDLGWKWPSLWPHCYALSLSLIWNSFALFHDYFRLGSVSFRCQDRFMAKNIGRQRHPLSPQCALSLTCSLFALLHVLTKPPLQLRVIVGIWNPNWLFSSVASPTLTI